MVEKASSFNQTGDRTMRSSTVIPRLLDGTLILVVGVLLAACSTNLLDESSRSSEEVSIRALGNSLIRTLVDGNIHVTIGPEVSGVVIETYRKTSGDVVFSPSRVSESGFLSASLLMADSDEPLATVTHRRLAAGNYAVDLDARGYGVDGLLLECLLNGRLHGTGEVSGITDEEISLGSSSDEVTSWHFVVEDDVIKLVFDYETAPEGSSMLTFDSLEEEMACSHVQLTPSGPMPERAVRAIELSGSGFSDLVLHRDRLQVERQRGRYLDVRH
jgi:hypothetical protein